MGYCVNSIHVYNACQLNHSIYNFHLLKRIILYLCLESVNSLFLVLSKTTYLLVVNYRHRTVVQNISITPLMWL